MELRGLREMPSWFVRSVVLFVVLIGLALLLLGPALAQPAPSIDKPVLLVASQELTGPYAGTVIHAVPFQDGHIGLILNRPTVLRVIDAFPDFAPAGKVVDVIYRGGPTLQNALFAVVKAEGAKAPNSIELMPGVWLEGNHRIVDAIIEATPNEARYFVGVVAWHPGELAEELRSGFFVVRPADAGKFFAKDVKSLYQQLQPAPRKGRHDA